MVKKFLEPYLKTISSTNAENMTASPEESSFIEQRVATQHVTEPAILDIRTHHMWDDWKQANRWMGQSPLESIYTPPLDDEERTRDQHFIYNGTKQVGGLILQGPPVTKELSEKGQARLCRALEGEYHAYFFFIDRALNLSPSERRKSYEMAQKNCPNLFEFSSVLLSL